jgi:hypothetical protein
MSMSVGASSSAASYLQQLMKQGSAGATGAANALDPLSELMPPLSGSGATQDQSSANTTPRPPAGAGSPPFGANTMSTLISMQDQSANGTDPSSQMFAKLDTDGDGQISKSEFENALSGGDVNSAATDAIFAKLDSNGDGSVSQSELASAKPANGQHHSVETKENGSSAQGAFDPLSSLAGATTKTATNSNGSSTTTTTYADGTMINMTTPASSTNNGTSGNGTSNGTSN